MTTACTDQTLIDEYVDALASYPGMQPPPEKTRAFLSAVARVAPSRRVPAGLTARSISLSPVASSPALPLLPTALVFGLGALFAHLLSFPLR